MIVAMLTMAASVIAQPPPLYFNYQGRLTDDMGEPITNISPGVVLWFTIWNDETASDPANVEWTSGAVAVPVENGLFNYQLGPLSVALLTDIFTSENHWLGIRVGIDPEISPRTKLTSVPYAIYAGAAGSVTDIYVNESGDMMTGDLRFDFLDDGQTDALIDAEPNNANIELFHNGTITTKLWGADYGGLSLWHENDGNGRAALNAIFGGGDLSLYDDTETRIIHLNAASLGDYAVSFPNDAIHSQEILNEPGIANNTMTSYVTLTTTMDDLQSLTIEIPAGGYIFLEGWCGVDVTGATTENFAVVQIDETTGGSTDPGYFAQVGMNTYPSSGYHSFQVYVSRVYFKPPGSYDFILEGMKSQSTHTINCYYPNLTATYYPTSYMPIKVFSSNTEGHPEAKAVTATDRMTKDEQTVYELDLRHYELKAKEARIKALEAEMELHKAQSRLAKDMSNEE
jgi:hypothetical protein